MPISLAIGMQIQDVLEIDLILQRIVSILIVSFLFFGNSSVFSFAEARLGVNSGVLLAKVRLAGTITDRGSLLCKDHGLPLGYRFGVFASFVFLENLSVDVGVDYEQLKINKFEGFKTDKCSDLSSLNSYKDRLENLLNSFSVANYVLPVSNNIDLQIGLGLGMKSLLFERITEHSAIELMNHDADNLFKRTVESSVGNSFDNLYTIIRLGMIYKWPKSNIALFNNIKIEQTFLYAIENEYVTYSVLSLHLSMVINFNFGVAYRFKV